MNIKDMDLHDRINRIINTHAFEQTLLGGGSSMIEFQLDWLDYGTFENLPPLFQQAILAGEEELAYQGPVEMSYA